MARNKSETKPAGVEITAEQTLGMAKAMQNVELSIDIERDEILNAGIDLGKLEALDFIATVALSSILPIYDNFKKSKAWKTMRNPKRRDGRAFESLEEFCEVKLGKSHRRMQEISANRKTIGQDAFEQAEKLGLRQVDYNAIKALPAGKQEIIKEALTEGADIETVTRALRQLVAEDQREIEALTKRAEEADADLAASRKRVGVKEAELEKKTKELARAKKHIESLTPDEIGAELRAEISQIAFNAEAEILGNLTAGFVDLDEHACNNGVTHEEFMAGCLCQIERALLGLRNRFNVKDKPDGDEMPDWLRPGAEEAAHAAIAEGEAKRSKRNKADPV